MEPIVLLSLIVLFWYWMYWLLINVIIEDIVIAIRIAAELPI